MTFTYSVLDPGRLAAIRQREIRIRAWEARLVAEGELPERRMCLRRHTRRRDYGLTRNDLQTLLRGNWPGGSGAHLPESDSRA